jgi:hypothetical protein
MPLIYYHIIGPCIKGGIMAKVSLLVQLNVSKLITCCKFVIKSMFDNLNVDSKTLYMTLISMCPPGPIYFIPKLYKYFHVLMHPLIKLN